MATRSANSPVSEALFPGSTWDAVLKSPGIADEAQRRGTMPACAW